MARRAKIHRIAHRRKRVAGRVTDIPAPGRHSSCLLCGALYFDRYLTTCPRCGGEVHLYREADVRLLGRRAEQPPAVKTERVAA